MSHWHNPCVQPGMPFRVFLLLLAGLLPSPAAAQAWLDAYNGREYEKAVILLHEIVSDPEFVMNGRDPLPLRHLARLYANGLGVSPDAIAACALAQDAEMATQMAGPTKPILTTADAEQYRAGLDEARAFTAAHCGALWPADLAAASRSRGCYAFGMPEKAVALGGRSIRIGRSGIALADTPERDLPGLPCAIAIGRVRAVSIEPPDNAAPGIGARHFVELVMWRAGTDQRTGIRVYVPSWQMYEVRPGGVALVVEEMLDGSARWPGLTVPPNVEAGLTLAMIRSGHVRWRIDGAPPRRGWIMLPEGARRRDRGEECQVVGRLPARGHRDASGARVYGRVNEWVHHPADEQAIDHGPLENITVNVRGATFSRDLLTDRNGRYEMTGLPLGPITISLVTPFGFDAGAERNMDVKDLRGCAAADFIVQARTRAHGVVVDQAGRPVAGVAVEAVAEELAGYLPTSIHAPGKTDGHGRFSFDALPPGAYVFGINLTKSAFRPHAGRQTFLPGTAVASEAAVFTLKPGDRTDVGTIRLPKG